MKLKTIATIFTLLTPTLARANDWPAWRADGTGSRASVESAGATFSPAWTYKMKSGGRMLSTPVSVDGVVVATSDQGDVAALGLQDGHEQWARTLDAGVGATPAVSNGRIVVSSLGAQLYGLDLGTGAVSWQRDFGGSMNYASPTIVGDANGGLGTMIVPEGFPAQDVQRVDVATGAASWTTADGAIADLLYTTAAVVGDQAIVGMNGGRYQSLDLATGATRWKFDTTGPANLSSALVVGKRVYMFPGDAQSQLWAVDLDTGAAISGFPIAIPDVAPVAGSAGMLGRGPAMSSPIEAGGLIIVQLRRQDMLHGQGAFGVVMRDYVAAIDPTVPKVVWQHELANVTVDNSNGVPELNTCPTPVAFAGANGPVVAVASSTTAAAQVLDVATGALVWSATLSGSSHASPVFTNGQLLFATDAGVLHAFSADADRAPAAPTGLVASGDSVSWNAMMDADGHAASYVVRVVGDGATSTTTDFDMPVGGSTFVVSSSAAMNHVSVRARSARGALSAWSSGVVVHGGAVVAATSNGAGGSGGAMVASGSGGAGGAMIASGSGGTAAAPATTPSCAPPAVAAAPVAPTPAPAAASATPVATAPAAAPAATSPTASGPIVTILEPTAAPSPSTALTVPTASVSMAMTSMLPTLMAVSPHAGSTATAQAGGSSLADQDDLAGGCSVGASGHGANAASVGSALLALAFVARRSRKRSMSRN
ncbi:MAG TPA: PQQ-binding-like beta-propeller repeat protein [Polyangia bacterium]|nr:PQQ-binding-like beta-propeller repeat protein [Polyangia bacterium]